MHIPNGCLSIESCWVTSIAAVSAASALVAVRRRFTVAVDWQRFGLLAAGIFVAQMINFPVASGTSGHLLGGAAAGIVLGPTYGMACLLSVLALQCLLLGDGGVTAFGANALNMAIIAPLIGYTLFHRLRNLKLPLALATAVTGSASVLVAAMSCGAELALGGTVATGAALSAMLSAHLLVALCEGLATTAIIGLLPAHTRQSATSNLPTQVYLTAVVVLLVIIAVGVHFSSGLPDGLETTLAQLLLEPVGDESEWSPLATSMRGLLGCLSLAGASYIIGCRHPRRSAS